MKKHICIILLAALLLLCACQPTPENPIVVGKDQDIMIGKAEEEAVYVSLTPDPGEQRVDWADRLGAPEHYTATLTSANGHLHVEVDANVYLPDTELPIVRVEQQRFTDEDARRFATALLGENPQCIDPYQYNNRTKAMYEEDIRRRMDALDNWEDYGSIVYDQYETKAEFQAALKKLMEEAEHAPDTLDTFAPTYEWRTMYEGKEDGLSETQDQIMELLTLNADGTRTGLNIIRSTSGSSLRYTRNCEEPVSYPFDCSQYPNELKTTEVQAIAIAEETLTKMGLTHLRFALIKSIRNYTGDVARKNNPYRPYWAIVFTPEVNGAQMTYAFQRMTEVSEYNRMWQNECCFVMVDDDGIAALSYNSPCSVSETSVSAASLMPFEKIREIFEKMVLIVDNDADLEGIDVRYRITNVRLGLVSIPEQNGDGGLLVPAWDFIGIWEYDDHVPDEQRELGRTTDETWSYLTINAVDGSIIKRQP